MHGVVIFDGSKLLDQLGIQQYLIITNYSLILP